MGSIEKYLNQVAGMTIYTAAGKVTGEEVMKEIMDFYEQGPVTRNVLWDLTAAELTDLRREDIQRISKIPREHLELRQGGRTAIVAPTDLAFGLSRMYKSSSEVESLPFELRVFRDLQHARDWLAEKKTYLQ